MLVLNLSSDNIYSESSEAGDKDLSSWVNKRVPSLLGNLTLGILYQADYLTGTSAHAPQKLGTVGLGPHWLMCH
ncbi:hypothetical protein TNCV_239161 [Trichonephila clavipes]|nr:hypothetical protein TNCV_239161 [Trichonephila clavipes]